VTIVLNPTGWVRVAKRREQAKIQTKQQEKKIWQELSRISLKDLCIRAQDVGVERSLLDNALESARPKHQVSALVVEREMFLLQAQPGKQHGLTAIRRSAYKAFAVRSSWRTVVSFLLFFLEC
jgi:hypothetical protein